MRLAVVGSGVSGLVAAHGLRHRHDVTLFEADGRLGGHANTVEVTVGGSPLAVDTGFLVYNERNYPGFVALLDQLGVATQPSDMSFSVHDERSGVQWRGTDLDSVLAQRRRATDPRFLRMLVDVVRFNRTARRLVARPADEVDLDLTVEDVLVAGHYSRWFRSWYLVPMGAAIWSADPSSFTRFPAAVLAGFLVNLGLLRLGDVPKWRTVTGGSKRYVDAMAGALPGRIRLSTPVQKVVRRTDGVELLTERGTETFDRVVLATHSDQALRLLADASETERSVLGAIRYQPNVATLHTDGSLLPPNRRARAAWNYHVPGVGELGSRASLTYHLNALQRLDTDVDVCVTLNRPEAPDPGTVVEHIHYAHPVFDADAVRAQRRFDEIDGRGGVHYCGAYWGHGFHEDGVQSGLELCRRLGAVP
ncbi:MAG: NAD(P)/FAD-dependent oxidoreductase [Acidimicrobiia bacterium]